jgi:hypothetical protein
MPLAAAVCVLALAPSARADEGIASTVFQFQGDVWVHLNPGPGPAFTSTTPAPRDFRVVNDPFRKILAQHAGKDVRVTLSVKGTDASVTKLRALWSPPPYKPTEVWVTGGDGKTFTIDPNPYGSRPAFADELSIDGVPFPKPPADELPLPVSAQPKPVDAPKPPEKPLVAAPAAPTKGLVCGLGDAIVAKPTTGSVKLPIRQGQSIALIAGHHGLTARELLDLKGPDGKTNEERLKALRPNLERNRGRVYLVYDGEEIYVPGDAKSSAPKAPAPETSPKAPG